mgnify:CR=1 FL=1
MHDNKQSSGGGVSTVPDIEVVIVRGDLDWDGWYVNGELVAQYDSIYLEDALRELMTRYPDGLRITKVEVREYDPDWLAGQRYLNLPSNLESVKLID